jgi:phosphate:Na+ symporter
VRDQGDDSAAILSLDGLKLDMKENDARLLDRLDKLVRKDKISAHMATSLINDSSYAYDVTKNLVKMGEVLFSSGDSGVRSIERSLALDVDEMDDLFTETKTNIERML